MRKNMVRTVICIVAVMSLLSCAGGPKFSVVQPKLVSDNPVDGRIFFYRPSAFGAALNLM